MACYGIKTCLDCFGFGVVLTSAEIAYANKAVIDVAFGWNKIKLKQFIVRKPGESVRCPACKGPGWRLVAGHSKMTLPTRTIKRW